MAVRYSGGFGKKPSYTYGPDEVPHATGGKVQPASPRGKKIKVKAHTRVVKPKVTKPTGGPSGNPILDALVRQRFGGVEQNLKQQLASNARFTSGVPAWYAQAINEIKGIGAQGATQGQQAIAQAQNYNSPVAATGTPDAAQAANARNNLNSQYATMLTRDQQANQDFLNRLSGAMQVQQGNTLNQANVQRQNILGQQGQLAQQKGDFKTTYAAQQATAQAKTDIENKKIQAGLLIAQGKTDAAMQVLGSLNQDRKSKNNIARTNARTQRIRVRNDQMKSDRQYNLDVQKFGAAQAKQNWQETHPKPSDAKTAADLKYFKQHGYYPPTGPPKTGKNAPGQADSGADEDGYRNPRCDRPLPQRHHPRSVAPRHRDTRAATTAFPKRSSRLRPTWRPTTTSRTTVSSAR
jgi:hypothetical protein